MGIGFRFGELFRVTFLSISKAWCAEDLMYRQSAEKILSHAVELQAEAADVFLRSSTSSTIEVKDKKVDAFDRARDLGVGVR